MDLLAQEIARKRKAKAELAPVGGVRNAVREESSARGGGGTPRALLARRGGEDRGW